MNIDLISSDIELFLKKYTRFMSKGIYITNIVYDRFISNYKYLYDEIDKNKYLYQDSYKYLKMMSIINNKSKLIRLHNKKYIDSMLKKITNPDEDKNSRKLILCEEKSILIIEKKYMNIITYLTNYYGTDNVLILTDNYNKYKEIKTNINNALVYDIDTYCLNLLSNKFKLITDKDKYKILSSYIKNILFKDKEKFQEFLTTFKDYLYFNKDTKKYNNFKEYHEYIFERMFLKEKVSKKDFIKNTIRKRRNYLRSINDELLLSKIEVDIANFLYLNNIKYTYDTKLDCFHIYNGDTKDTIKYIKDNNYKNDKEIIIYSKYIDKRKPIQHLAYELINKRYPMEKLSDDKVYNTLKDTCEDGYFSNLLSKTIIPIIDNYDSFKNIQIDNHKINIISKFNDYYQEYLSNNNLIDINNLLKISINKINTNYKCCILLEDYNNLLSKYNIDKLFNKSIIINYNYQNNLYLSNTIKEKYNYKQYLNDNKIIPINNTYLNYQEILDISNNFIKDNIDILNEEFDYNKIIISEYDDNLRLFANKNRSILLNEIISKLKGNILILGKNIKDKDNLFDSTYFKILDKNKIISKTNKKVNIDYYLYKDKIDNIYNYIIITNILNDKHNDIKIDNITNEISIKNIIYNSDIKCKNKVIIIIPHSKKDIINHIINRNDKFKDIIKY